MKFLSKKEFPIDQEKRRKERESGKVKTLFPEEKVEKRNIFWWPKRERRDLGS